MPDSDLSIETSMALLRQEVGYVSISVQEIKTQMGSSFVTKDEFGPYKQKVDSVVRALVWVVGALVLGLISVFFKVVLK